MKVLIVDDNLINQIAIKKVLQDLIIRILNIVVSDSDFLYARTGIEALNKCQKDLGLVIMNGNLLGDPESHKKMDGPEVFIRICKKYPELENLVVGWSTDYETIDQWNEVIKAIYNSLQQTEKPERQPAMKFSLTKPIIRAEVEELIKKIKVNKEREAQEKLEKGKEEIEAQRTAIGFGSK